MSVTRRIFRIVPLPGLALLGLALGVGCSEDDGGAGPTTEDLVPNTYLTVGPSNSQPTSHRVQLRWSTNTLPQGSGPAPRTADHFEIAWEDTTTWIGPITTTDSTFIVSAAEMCCVEPLPGFPTPLPDSVFSEFHTFYVRGVSPGGKIDPTPASVTFDARTLAPTSTLTAGPVGAADSLCPTTTIEWTATDFDGEVASYEYAVVSSFEYETAHGALPVDAAEVIDWLLDDPTGLWTPTPAASATLTGLTQTQTGTEDDNLYWCAVRAIDDGGAREQNLTLGRNIASFEVLDLEAAGGPLLTIIAQSESNPSIRTWTTGGPDITQTVSVGIWFIFFGEPVTACTEVNGYAVSIDGGATFTDFSTDQRWPPTPGEAWQPAVGDYDVTVRARDDNGQTRDLTARVTFQ